MSCELQNYKIYYDERTLKRIALSQGKQKVYIRNSAIHYIYIIWKENELAENFCKLQGFPNRKDSWRAPHFGNRVSDRF